MGLGLLRDRPAYGTPGINPNAPDPLGGLGQQKPPLGLGTQAQAPAQGVPGLGAQPAAPSSLPPQVQGQRPNVLSEIALRLADGQALAQGRPLASQQMAQQRTQALQAQLQQFQQGLAVVETIRQGLDRLPADKQESAAKAVRDELAVKVPGLAPIYDATVGDRSVNAKFALEAAAKSNTIKYMVAMGFPQAAIAEFAKTDEFRAEVQQTQDKTLTPIVTSKVERILASDDPEIGPLVRQRQADGFFTPPEVRAINGSLPDEYKLTDEELDTLDRQQGAISQVFQGRLSTTEEYEAKKSADLKGQTDANAAVLKERELRKLGVDQGAVDQVAAETKARIEAETDARAKAPPDPAKLSDVSSARKEFTNGSGDFIKIRDAIYKIETVSQNPSAAGDLALIFSFMRILDPASTVREGEQASAQNAAGVPDQVRNVYNRLLSGERLTPNQRADFLSQSRGLVDAQMKSQLQLEEQFRGVAERNGMRPEDVVLDYIGPDLRAQYEKRQKSAGGDRVRVRMPDGKVGTVPSAQLQTALDRGGVQVQ